MDTTNLNTAQLTCLAIDMAELSGLAKEGEGKAYVVRACAAGRSTVDRWLRPGAKPWAKHTEDLKYIVKMACAEIESMRVPLADELARHERVHDGLSLQIDSLEDECSNLNVQLMAEITNVVTITHLHKRSCERAEEAELQRESLSSASVIVFMGALVFGTGLGAIGMYGIAHWMGWLS